MGSGVNFFVFCLILHPLGQVSFFHGWTHRVVFSCTVWVEDWKIKVWNYHLQTFPTSMFHSKNCSVININKTHLYCSFTGSMINMLANSEQYYTIQGVYAPNICSIKRSLHPTSLCDVSGVIVLTSCVCVSVCPCVRVLPLSQPNGQTYRLEFWHGGQVEGYLGQVHRSRS